MIQNRDLTSLVPVTKFVAHQKYITRVLLSPDVKQLATCSADHTAKIWRVDTNTFQLEATLTGHQRWVWDCAFSADSAYLVTACSDHYARLWELKRYVLLPHIIQKTMFANDNAAKILFDNTMATTEVLSAWL